MSGFPLGLFNLEEMIWSHLLDASEDFKRIDGGGRGDGERASIS